jgi:hypothetical protein
MRMSLTLKTRWLSPLHFLFSELANSTLEMSPWLGTTTLNFLNFNAWNEFFRVR